MKALGIINFSGHHIRVEGMQDYRPIGAFSFLGRYRAIDFPISNMSNSGIDQIQVYVNQKPRSLAEHLGTGRHYNINSKRGKLQLLFSETERKIHCMTPISRHTSRTWNVSNIRPALMWSLPRVI